jgi:hypothetical protein
MPRLSVAAYVAQFTLAAPAPSAPPAVPPVVPEVVHITNDEEEEPMEVDVTPGFKDKTRHTPYVK